jgi:hypothetical protein
MIRLNLLVEGQTEETFVRDVLAPYYEGQCIYIKPIIVSTSRGHKGGVVSHAKVKPQLTKLCREDANAFVSTMFDLYALPNDFPGKNEENYPAQGNGHAKALFLEFHLNNDIGERNFIPNLMVHEFEALLFADTQKFSDWEDDRRVIQNLVDIAVGYNTPEDINDSPHTAPSKRILKLMPHYDKVVHGSLIAYGIGLDAMRASCPHFAAWLVNIESLKSEAL